ncbi:MAG TPA: prolyl oligopeptidase family serine peptidase [Thermoanaerobaculia bacterium]|nr:prolyl oligopeptidase family serine peptidase [Thermoanaerobaculia bacterium]
MRRKLDRFPIISLAALAALAALLMGWPAAAGVPVAAPVAAPLAAPVAPPVAPPHAITADRPAASTTSAAASLARLAYPEAQRLSQVDDYHGVRVADPYRWLEDPDSPQTRAWVEAENRVTGSFLGTAGTREQIRRRLTELWNYERFGVPQRRGNRYFFTRNDGLQNQSVLYTLPAPDAPGKDGDLAHPPEPTMLLDPNTLSADGTVALSNFDLSDDGSLMAYGLASGGSDWQEFRVRDVATGKDLPDVLRWIKFSPAAWTRDGRGFFYSRFAEPAAGRALEDANFNQKLYYHRLGTPQASDELICERPQRKELGFAPVVTDDGRYLVIHVTLGTKVENGIYYKDLQVPGSPVVELIGGFEATYQLVGNDGPTLWFLTNAAAPRRRIVAIDLRAPARERWRELVPQAAETLETATCVGERLIASYLQDAHARVRIFGLDGHFLSELPLPGLGTVDGFPGKRTDRETFFSFTSFTSPATIYRYDLTSGGVNVFRRARVNFDFDAYETRQIFYRSKDGTRVPMFITCKKGLVLDGTHPAYLHGYGGFDISVTPAFQVSNLVWLERGGVYAEAILRGGGEYGEEWHLAGSRLRKQNTFDDFIAAAQWLIDNGYTSRARLAIGGESNGGLLAAAALVQRPDLFGAVKIGVGVLDMLRFHKFTVGWGWVSDYGSPDDPQDFKALYAYSPYHNLRPGTSYPATLITTADHDDRVVPAHSFKFAAALQHAQAGAAPVLIRIDTRAGHGRGKPTAKLIEQAADEWSFLEAVLQPAAAGRPAG